MHDRVATFVSACVLRVFLCHPPRAAIGLLFHERRQHPSTLRPRFNALEYAAARERNRLYHARTDRCAMVATVQQVIIPAGFYLARRANLLLTSTRVCTDSAAVDERGEHPETVPER